MTIELGIINAIEVILKDRRQDALRGIPKEVELEIVTVIFKR